jgi:hypothetical protein
MEVNRKALLEVLEAVQPGLSAEGTIEQSDCFVFRDGRVFTYDDEVACSAECSVEMTGAVRAKPLLELLNKLPEEVLEMEVTESELRVKGQRRKSGVRMEHEILLAVGAIGWPKEKDWKPLPSDFCEAAEVARQCVSKDSGAFSLTCVHIGPKFMESCDNDQATRYNLKTGFKEDALIRSRAVLHLGHMSVTEFAEAEGWVHFRNANGLTLSCRRYAEDFPDLTSVLEVNGSKVQLPEGLAAAADLARVFSKDSVENDKVQLSLRGNKLIVQGEGPTGWYRETKAVEYEGDDLMFRIAPSMLKSVLARSTECWLAEDKLWIDAGKFVYVTSLDASQPAEEE